MSPEDGLFELLRESMVAEQLEAGGIEDERVLAAMGSVPREKFVSMLQRGHAYDDGPLPIGDGQTISQPYMVAKTLELARLSPTDTILDVGTGCGYAAAVASLLVKQVFSIERNEGLAREAAQRLRDLGYDNVHVAHGDGTKGWAEHAPFSAIVAAAAGDAVPVAWKQQLRDGGRIVAPLGPAGGQHLVVVTRAGATFRQESLFTVRYVPLVEEDGSEPPRAL